MASDRFGNCRVAAGREGGDTCEGCHLAVEIGGEWWKEASAALRDERFTPIADRAVAVGCCGSRAVPTWAVSSSKGLDNGAKSPGDCRWQSGKALGVMSQGELHSLALSLFSHAPRCLRVRSGLSRLTITSNRWIRPESRATRALADVARTRQVIVFTHRRPPPEAVRRLGIPTTVLRRDPPRQSLVEVRQTLDRSAAFLTMRGGGGASPELPKAVAPRVVPGFCRLAIETACMETVRAGGSLAGRVTRLSRSCSAPTRARIR